MLTAQQQDIRRKGIGASEIAAVAGLSPWSSPLDVYLDKLGLADPSHSPQTELGDELEEPIARIAARRLVIEILPGKTMTHPSEPWALATPDRLVMGRPEGMEIKNVGYRVAHHWTEEEDGIPDYVRSQVEWQMECCGLERVHVAALLGGRDIRLYTIERDAELAAGLLAIGRRFWFDHVIAQIPPPPGRSEADAAALARLYPRDAGPILPAPAEADRWAEQLRDARSVLAIAEEREREAKNALKALIREAAGMEGRDWKVTWRAAKSGSIDYKAICEELGASKEQFEKHRRPGARRFLATWRDE